MGLFSKKIHHHGAGQVDKSRLPRHIAHRAAGKDIAVALVIIAIEQVGGEGERGGQLMIAVQPHHIAVEIGAVGIGIAKEGITIARQRRAAA